MTNKEEITLLQSMARADIEALSEVLNNSVKTSVRRRAVALFFPSKNNISKKFFQFARSPELDAQSIVAFDRRKVKKIRNTREGSFHFISLDSLE